MTKGAQTADRVLHVLEIAVEAGEPLELAELSERAGLNKPTTYRLVQTLVERSLLTREPDGRKYMIGSGLVALAGAVINGVAVRQIARPMMTALAEETSETVSLSLLHGRHHVCVAVAEGRLPIRRVVPIGETVPLYEGTASKAMLAWLPEPDVEEILRWCKEQARNVTRLRADIKKSRDNGYYAAANDRFEGAAAVSAPIFDTLQVRGAITISGPSNRFTQQSIEQVAPRLRREALELSYELGYRAGESGYRAGDQQVESA